MSRELISQLKDLKKHVAVAPNDVWVKQTREKVVAHARNTARENAPVRMSVADIAAALHILFPKKMYFAMRGVFVFTLVIGVAASGLIASASPLPRGIVYNVKVAVATATGNDKAKAILHIEEATHQSKEIKQISDSTIKGTEKKVKKKLKKIQKQVSAATESLTDLEGKDKVQATELAKDLTEKTTIIADQLEEVSRGVASEEGTDSAEEEGVLSVVKEVIETRKAVNQTGINAIGVLAQSDDLDDTTKTIVQDKITEIIENTQEVQTIAVGIKDKVVAAAPAPVVASAIDNPASTTTAKIITDGVPVPAASSTEVGSGISTVSGTTVQAEATAQTVEKAAHVVEDISHLLEGQQLTEAIQKTKELNDLNTEAESSLVDLSKSVQKDAQNLLDASATSGSSIDSTKTVSPDTSGQIGTSDVQSAVGTATQ